MLHAAIERGQVDVHHLIIDRRRRPPRGQSTTPSNDRSIGNSVSTEGIRPIRRSIFTRLQPAIETGHHVVTGTCGVESREGHLSRVGHGFEVADLHAPFPGDERSVQCIERQIGIYPVMGAQLRVELHIGRNDDQRTRRRIGHAAPLFDEALQMFLAVGSGQRLAIFVGRFRRNVPRQRRHGRVR